MSAVEANSTAAQPPLPLPHLHLESLSHKQGLRHHKLTRLHDPHMSDFLSASKESAEDVPVTRAVAEAPTVNGTDAFRVVDKLPMDMSSSDEVPLIVNVDVANTTAGMTEPVSLIQLCPGVIRFF